MAAETLRESPLPTECIRRTRGKERAPRPETTTTKRPENSHWIDSPRHDLVPDITSDHHVLKDPSTHSLLSVFPTGFFTRSEISSKSSSISDSTPPSLTSAVPPPLRLSPHRNKPPAILFPQSSSPSSFSKRYMSWIPKMAILAPHSLMHAR